MRTAERVGLESALRALIEAVGSKDPYTRGHSERVARTSELIGRQLDLSETLIHSWRLAGLLHDVGKLCLPGGLLRKPEPLNDLDYAEILRHPALGVELVADLGLPAEVLDGVLHHHERVDGSGYPAGLAGSAIPAVARAVAVADAFDAMTTTRSYRRARTSASALAELRVAAGAQFDPVMVVALTSALTSAGPMPAIGGQRPYDPDVFGTLAGTASRADG